MVNRKSLSAGHGIQGWLQQRITAVIMLLAILVLFVVMFLANKIIDANFISWKQFFSLTFIKVFTSLTFFAVIMHAWVGMRDVWLDYAKSHGLRIALHSMTIVWLLGSFIYSLVILWA